MAARCGEVCQESNPDSQLLKQTSAPDGVTSDGHVDRLPGGTGGVGGEPADSEVLSVMGDVLAKAEAVVGVFERVAQLEGTAHHADTRVHAGDVTRANMPPEPASKREDLSESVHHKVCRGCRNGESRVSLNMRR